MEIFFMLELLSMADLALVLKVSRRSVIRWRDNGTLPPSCKIGRAVRWRRGDIEHWIDSGCVPWHKSLRRGRA